VTFHCRFCAAPLKTIIVDLGLSPLSNSLLRSDQLAEREITYPLQPYVCESCWLVQLPEFAASQSIFNDYVYFSSFSSSWMRHVEEYAAAMSQRLNLGERSLVVEVGSNDGHLLGCFERRHIPVLGIEPAANVAAVAVANGIRTESVFFGVASAQSLRSGYGAADLIAGNNVLAHVPDLNDFVGGLQQLLKPEGTITMEFPHLLRLIERTEFDTIYHEHFSYFSLAVVQRIFDAHKLAVYDVEELPTHGGSLRIFATHASVAPVSSERIHRVAASEKTAALESLAPYASFANDVRETKSALLGFFSAAADQGKTIAGYGAPAKATTLLNYAGIGPTLLPYTVDRNPMKQGKYIPGVRIPIESPERIANARPDYVMILPWNWADEIRDQMAFIREWGGRFVVPIPRATVLS
jgi:SAM-dependent methyltransferase